MADCDISIGAVVEVAAIGSAAGEDIINVYQLQLVGGGGQTLEDMGDGIAEWAEDLYALVKLFCNVLVTWTGIQAQHLNGNCSTGFVPLANAQTGALNTGAVPFGAAALVTFSTGVKRVTPRKYFGILDESVIDVNGLIASSFLDELDAVVTFLMTDYVSSHGTWRYGYQSPKTAEFEFPIAGSVKREPGYQRRRRRGVGS